MLIDLHYYLYSCQYGTFLFNSEFERTQHDPQNNTISVWDYFNTYKEKYTNELYDPKKDHDLVDNGGVLFPEYGNIKYWFHLFHRQEIELNDSPVYGVPITVDPMGLADNDVPL